MFRDLRDRAWFVFFAMAVIFAIKGYDLDVVLGFLILAKLYNMSE